MVHSYISNGVFHIVYGIVFHIVKMLGSAFADSYPNVVSIWYLYLIPVYDHVHHKLLFTLSIMVRHNNNDNS